MHPYFSSHCQANLRSDIAPELLDWIIARTQITPPARSVDVGSGTGIAARLFAARGFEVIGVEPNEAMRLHAGMEESGVTYRAGEATATGLPSDSAAMIYAA